MEKRKKLEKGSLNEFETQVKDIRAQFGEQLKSFEGRTESQVSLLADIADYYRRRSEVEAEYSRNLDKLAKHFGVKSGKLGDRASSGTGGGHYAGPGGGGSGGSKMDINASGSQLALYTLWQDVLHVTKTESKYRSILGDIYGGHIVNRLNNHSDALQRISKRCREIAFEAQQEILRVLNELHTALKTYQVCHTESCNAEGKFKAIESQKLKFEECNPKKLSSRKYRLLEKEYDKKQGKYQEFKLKALKARNEYLLCIDAANAALHKYFADDISDLLDCMDVGSCLWLRTTFAAVTEAGRCISESNQASLNGMNAWLESMDSRVDKQRFLEANHSLFMLPRRLEFQAHKGDEIKQVSAQKSVQEDLIQRYSQLGARLGQLRTETEEVWKTLETAEKTLLRQARHSETQVEELFQIPSGAGTGPDATVPSRRTSVREGGSNVCGAFMENGCTGPPVSGHGLSHQGSSKGKKQDLTELEAFYLNKFREYSLTSNLTERLSARYRAIQSALGISSGHHTGGPLHHQHCDSSRTTTGSSSNASSGSPANSCCPSTEHIHHNGGQGSPSFLLMSSDQHFDFDGSHNSSACIMNGLTGSNEPYPGSSMSSSGEQPSNFHLPNRPPTLPPKPRKKRIGRSTGVIAPKLFGGSIEEYVESTGQEIPLIIRSCIRMLGIYGLHHQGVFRVSGSQLEINAFKEAFERGEDPLSDVTDASDVNSVAGVLKLYFRGLREPLFPIYMFDQFMQCTKCSSHDEFIFEVSHLVQKLPRPVFVVMRYLFAFLNHLSEFSDESMMDPYNLAICFGPTLIPIPETEDQVFYHNNVNELVRNLILFHEQVFDQSSGLIYEKYLLSDDVEETDGALQDPVSDCEEEESIECLPASDTNSQSDTSESLPTLTTGTYTALQATRPPEMSGTVSQHHSEEGVVSQQPQNGVERPVLYRPNSVPTAATRTSLGAAATDAVQQRRQGAIEGLGKQHSLRLKNRAPDIPESGASSKVAIVNGSPLRSPSQGSPRKDFGVKRSVVCQGTTTEDDPTAEIQAVLNSLESFSNKSGANSSCSRGSPFPTTPQDPPPPAPLSWTKKASSELLTRITLHRPAGQSETPPADPGRSGAETFAMEVDGTIRKSVGGAVPPGDPADASIDSGPPLSPGGSTSASSRCGGPKPPLPKKPPGSPTSIPKFPGGLKEVVEISKM